MLHQVTKVRPSYLKGHVMINYLRAQTCKAYAHIVMRCDKLGYKASTNNQSESISFQKALLVTTLCVVPKWREQAYQT